jgi:hypothetical protein
VSFAELTSWAYLNRRPWRLPIYRALCRYATNVGFGMWAPNADLAELISPKKH